MSQLTRVSKKPNPALLLLVSGMVAVVATVSMFALINRIRSSSVLSTAKPSPNQAPAHRSTTTSLARQVSWL